MTTLSKKIDATLKQKIFTTFFQKKVTDGITWWKTQEIPHHYLQRGFRKIFGMSVAYKKSYSQCGEDLIVDYLFKLLGVKQPTYLDIGANNPVYLNNTYHFYENGSRGVLVEPSIDLHKKLVAKRKRDTCLNVGVGIGNMKSADFYIMSSHTLSTFSKDEALRYQSYGKQKIEKIINLPLVSVNDIIRENFATAPDFVSLDIEGLDYAVLESLDFNTFRPKVFCIETLTYTEDRFEEKIQNIPDFLSSKGYILYADTYINSIFVDKNAWTNRRI